MARVLAIPDLHIPFHAPNYLSFLKKVYKHYKCDTVVCLGDELDFHGISFHDHDPDLPSPGDEMKLCFQELKKLYKAFPDVSICTSNHTSRPFRKAFKSGLPSMFIRSYREFMQAPVTWQWKARWVIDNVQYIHGEGFSGKYGALRAAESHRQSTVMGHIHSFGGVTYSQSHHNRIFAMNAGCLIDPDHLAFAYGKNFPHKPTLGCGVVLDGKQAHFIPM